MGGLSIWTIKMKKPKELFVLSFCLSAFSGGRWIEIEISDVEPGLLSRWKQGNGEDILMF